ncbi:MAG: SirB2 family protein [Burkholderiaceae bacterium]
MPDYTTLKMIHMTTAVLSITGFVLRYLWMIADSALLRHRATRVLPHIIDTVLLVSAILMLVQARLAPWLIDWLAFKIVALLVYIVLGAIALKRGTTRGTRIVAGVAAIAVFTAILWAARYKAVPLLGVFA